MHTLCVINGPLEASDDCAKKRKVAVNRSSSEITKRWKFAIVKNINSSYDENLCQIGL